MNVYPALTVMCRVTWALNWKFPSGATANSLRVNVPGLAVVAKNPPPAVSGVGNGPTRVVVPSSRTVSRTVPTSRTKPR